jgi:hypothetical protein
MLLDAIARHDLAMYRTLRAIRERLNQPLGTDHDAVLDVELLVWESLRDIHSEAGVDDLHGEPL